MVLYPKLPPVSSTRCSCKKGAKIAWPAARLVMKHKKPSSVWPTLLILSTAHPQYLLPNTFPKGEGEGKGEGEHKRLFVTFKKGGKGEAMSMFTSFNCLE